MRFVLDLAADFPFPFACVVCADFQETAQALASGAQGEAAVLEAVADDDGNRALHLAAREGRVEICRYLVKDLRLDVNQTNAKGFASLPVASILQPALF